MTSDFSNSQETSHDQFDIGPLSWVMGEVREAITSAGKLLSDAVVQDSDSKSTMLLHAKSYLHQAHGALQIVDIDGVSIVTETIEDLVERLQTGQLGMSQPHVDVINDAFHAILRYLEDLLSGGAHQPVRLFPYYRALLQLKGAERIHPADLFFPSLSVQEHIPELTLGSNIVKVDYSHLRQRFEKLLLVVLTNKDNVQQLQAVQTMHDLIAEVERVQTTPQTKAFWLVMRGFTEAVAKGLIKNEQYVKQIFGRINLQIRRLVDGVSSIPERLLRDALFFIAQVDQPSEFVAQIRRAYQLDNQVPLDYDQKNYGEIPANILVTAKEQVANLKNLWSRIANGDMSVADRFSQKMKDLADSCSQLNSSSLSKLLRELSGISRHAAHTSDNSKIGIELATSLLFVENALDHITRLPAHFSERADEITARLLSLVSGDEPPTQAAWMGEISREAQQRQTMSVLVAEMQSSLRQVEKVLDEYFRDPNSLEALTPVDPILHQIGGALAILDQDDVMLAVEHTRKVIGQFAGLAGTEHAKNAYQNVAQNIGALSFFIEILQSQPDTAKKKFNFDPDAGLLRTKLLDKNSDKELLPTSLNIALSSSDSTKVAEINHSTSHLADVVTAEQELLNQQHQSDMLVASLVEQPSNFELQAQLKDSLESERSVAALLDDANANTRANAAINLLDKAGATMSQDSLNDIVAATTHTVTESTPTYVPELPEGDEAIDAELLEIFLTEADEVLEFVRKTVPHSRHNPNNQEDLTSLRRSFHTLKGSGRMVGVTVFGEAAWSIEQVMNLWLSESRNGNENLYALLDKAADELTVWVEDLKQSGYSTRNGHAVIAAAERMKAGQDYSYIEERQATPLSEIANEVVGTPALQESIDAEPEVSEIVATQVVEENTSATEHESVEEVIQAIALEDEADDLHSEALTEHADLAAFVAEIPAHAELQEQDSPILDEPSHDLLVASPNADNLPDLNVDDVLPVLPLAEHLDDSKLDSTSLNSANLDVTNLDAPDQVADTQDTNQVSESADTAHATALTDNLIGTSSAQIIEFPDLSKPLSTQDDNVKRIGDIEISLPLHTIYMAETDEIVRFLAQDFAEWRHEPHRPVSKHAVHAAHSLAGSSATVGLKAVQELAHCLEMVLQRLERHPVTLDNAEYDVVDHSVDAVKSMLQKFALSEMAEHAPTEVRQLEKLLQAIIGRSDAGADDEFITSTNEKLDLNDLSESPDIVETKDLAAQSDSFVENSIDTAEDVSAETTEFEASEVHGENADTSLVDISQHDVPELTASLGNQDLVATEHPVLEVAEMPVVEDTHQATLASPPVLEWSEPDPEPEVQIIEVIAQPLETPAPADLLVDATVASAYEPAVLSSDPDLRIKDDLDLDLLPVFIEEGHDLLPMVGQLLRTWKQQPEEIAVPQSILRLMHTIKGSARMAGAMELGQHTHDMETRLENLMHAGAGGVARLSLMDDLLMRHDYSMQLFDRLQNPNAVEVQAPAAPLTAAQELDQFQETLSAPVAEVVQTPRELVSLTSILPLQSSSPSFNKAVSSTPRTTVPAATTPAAPVPLVRVRADILDRLVNQAGEVSISRSKLENEVSTLRTSLTELTDNVNRLRDQLREVEIQAETQITSRMAMSGDREFDPLEFDRFTRLQELTRMMAESVSDVSTVQNNLTRTIDNASNDLHVQARLTRDLQQDLMRVRMIPFASISERLYRVTRQTSKEVDKRVNLDIRGTSVEIDRSVLEKMVGPFEHLLRNAIVHGIESRESRRQNGKEETGELLVEIRQEGNEVVIHFTDDGQGLNLARIREKAKTVGLLGYDESASDAEAVNMIFEPGFSTANEVTELAGRGVGMDVVRSEAASLGGRVEVTSVEGKGAHFTIHLPLTLAVTQVVILKSGGKTFAVPSVLVEQVQQLKSAVLANAYNDGAIMWQGNRVAMHYLSTLLGENEVAPTSQQYTPLLIMKSGAERVAIHVDDIVGNREVVVKNIGPQLARMAGIAGATVLGSGEIVLILNPVPLAYRMEHEHARHPSATPTPENPEMGAVANLNTEPSKVQSVPVQGLRTQHTIMVVDDSLTVRRVTQRLLTREGYQVVLAKDGIDALEQLQSVTPDVMLVDIEMPRMDGFDLTRNVRSDARTSHIPIIMITSRTADKHRNYAQELGVNEYFGKPYREDDLLGAIVRFVGKEAVVI
ncbi:Hpt domain-containing protein [Undibacterium sp. RTI2.1]|uniref:hybrid sensor histidine kinase/response regulator n=2 Tax=Oxalobacteraceae TaxID=75682 RepID=UPI002B224940|nr:MULTISPECIES: Hpt domain-containing protein [unclassified Undibacterium]MEB0030628.1 Hpt domain-containing protein [Undibacterium sp. RTI2.1]MEB0116568.1 Hpt domain-containing protein [Undibacterium sp. RTI2.2]